jgi:hypothetical protein
MRYWRDHLAAGALLVILFGIVVLVTLGVG